MAPANGIELCYQEMGDPGGEPLLLVMGLATQMIAWDEEFCAMLADRGFRVVRFDNRDIGRSTRIKAAQVPGKLDMFIGRRGTAPYLLRDMAADTFGLMDHLGIDSANLVGASMGGMIVQTAAIERVVKTFQTIGSPGFPFEEERVRRIAGRSFDRGHSEAGIARQLHAITASGDRTPKLRHLNLPALVIHGSNDILVNPSGGRATAKAIPGARLKLVEGMGHDLPRPLWPDFVEEIAATAARASEATIAQPA